MYKVNWKPGAWGEGGETECVIQRSVFEPAGGEVVATFDDGQPAAITNKFGKGQSTLLAYAAGLTYSRFYRRTDLTYPVRYDALDRAVVIQAALDAGVVRPVKVSKPGVEATRPDSKAGTAIALIDHWVQEPTVTIELPFEKKPQKVRSVTSGDLQFKYENGQISFEVSFDNLDIVTIE
ncbi:MAG: hypothetical protein O3B01_31690 [Planctomycetota bacterium]|nr:hypothetical protein [Planctomycetota bacterium]